MLKFITTLYLQIFYVLCTDTYKYTSSYKVLQISRTRIYDLLFNKSFNYFRVCCSYGLKIMDKLVATRIVEDNFKSLANDDIKLGNFDTRQQNFCRNEKEKEVCNFF